MTRRTPDVRARRTGLGVVARPNPAPDEPPHDQRKFSFELMHNVNHTMTGMNDEITNRPRSGKPRNGGGGQTLSPRDILAILTIIALACVGGYFVLIKLAKG